MLQRIVSPDGVAYYRSPRLADAGVRHAFSTRVGGVSSGAFASLNLGNPSDGTLRDSADHIEQNYQRLCNAIGLSGLPRCAVHQVHGPAIVTVTAGRPFEAGQKADGLISEDPGRILAIRVADCVPVLLASADGRRCAAVHAGWRGVIAGIVPAAVKLLGRLGAQPVIGAIGPCISVQHFEVGAEVVATFQNAFGDHAPIFQISADRKPHIDLPAAIALQLAEMGIDQVDRTDRCTFEHEQEFFSHRRDAGVTGRMAALIASRLA